MVSTQTPEVNSPAMHFGPFSAAPSLGIDRANYIAVHSEDPAAAARYAVEHMGFYLVHVDAGGPALSRRPWARPLFVGLYAWRAGRGRSHLLSSYALPWNWHEPRHPRQGRRQERAGGALCALASWAGIALRNTSGQVIELTPGVNVDVPMAALVGEPPTTPGPITLDHAVVRAVDIASAFDFAARVMGLKESARIVAPDGIPVLGFFRCHTIFHCYAIARSQYDGLHHIQFTLKNPPAVHAAFEQMRDRGKVELIWGPLRHGAGHNVVFYFRDYTGNIVEFSAEEEIILNDATYVPRAWPVTDPRAGDEWNLSPIPPAMM